MTSIRARFRPHPRGFGFLTPVGDDGLTPIEISVEDKLGVDSVFVSPAVAKGLFADDLVDVVPSVDEKGVSADKIVLVERPRRMVVGTVVRGPGQMMLDPDRSIGTGWMGLAANVSDKVQMAEGRLIVVLVGQTEDGEPEGRALVAGPFVVGSPQAARATAVVVALGGAAPDLVLGGPTAVGLDPAATAATHARVVGLLANGGRGAAAGLDLAGPVPGAMMEAVDRRDEMCLTIDDASARDLDDAISAGWEGGEDEPVHVVVHIADAAAGVGIDSPADQYARTVASSAYFAGGSSAPMLDPALAEGGLSLLPNADRSAISVRFLVASDGAVSDVEVEFAWITSRAKLSYAAVEQWFEGDATDLYDEAGETIGPYAETALQAVSEAARRLGAKRDGRDTTESLFANIEVEPDVVDGKLKAVAAEPHAQAYKLIERLMVAANEAIAGWLAAKGVPALYRAHVGINPDRAGRLRAAAELAGVTIPALGAASVQPVEGEEAQAEVPMDRDAVISEVMAAISELEAAGNTAGRDLLAAAVTGSTARAQYDPDPAHHQGLGAEAYCHFTSPIRRYADLVVHRQVRAALAGETPPYTAEDLAAMAPWLDARAGAINRAQAWERGDLWALLLDRGYLKGAERAVVSGLSAAGIKVRLPRLGITGFIAAEKALGLEPKERGKLIVDGHGLSTTSGPWQLGSDVEVRFTRLDDTGRPAFRLGKVPARADA